jgi:hypothetical protein
MFIGPPGRLYFRATAAAVRYGAPGTLEWAMVHLSVYSAVVGNSRDMPTSLSTN